MGASNDEPPERCTCSKPPARKSWIASCQFRPSDPNMGAAMVSRCFNPLCSARFHYLEDGELFRLEFLSSPAIVDAEYFWLCKHCASSMTLALLEDGRVDLLSRPQYTHGVEVDMPLTVTRRPGMLLRSVSFWPRRSSTVNESVLTRKP